MKNLFIQRRRLLSRRNVLVASVLCLLLLWAVSLRPTAKPKVTPWLPPVEPAGVVQQTSEGTPTLMPNAPVVQPNASSPQEQIGTAQADTKTSPAAAGVDSAAVRTAVERWSEAWRKQDIDAYLAAYSKSFVPAAGQSRATWEKSRRYRIGSKKKIMHEVRHLQVLVQGDVATARFEQLYEADQIRSAGLKTLRLAREKNAWLIVSESQN